MAHLDRKEAGILLGVRALQSIEGLIAITTVSVCQPLIRMEKVDPGAGFTLIAPAVRFGQCIKHE
jgi:hypothetical protein